MARPPYEDAEKYTPDPYRPALAVGILLLLATIFLAVVLVYLSPRQEAREMRQITMHRAGRPAHELTLLAVGPRSERGDNTTYVVGNFLDRHSRRDATLTIQFDDPVADGALHGVTDEVLLATVIDRLEGRLRGPRPDAQLGLAAAAARQALGCLRQRREAHQENTCAAE